ncbi:MAG TPA: M1 family aminopeptidase [Polyangiaceae bacterium]|jgi:aminopeptidase N|nr:M1 family aminopeptidase [Polyangiaceae bacterium]
MRRASSVLTLLVLAACGGQAASVAPPAPAPMVLPQDTITASIPAPPPPRDDGRLPETVTPQRYSLELRIDPSQARFSGTTSIQVVVPRPTSYVVMHGRDMHVTRAVARAGDIEVPATAALRVAHGGVEAEELVLAFAQPLAAGTAVIEVAYDAPFAADLAGLYRVQEGGAWYAYTQFEATDARRAFPCFDEPGFKTAYDVTIASPRGTIALGNAPETGHEDTPDGMVVHHFQTTRPLPSYLVAFAVGDFDVVEGQSSPFPIRAITPKGKGALTSLALEASAALIAKLGDYFDVRYPYPKLDIVAVPDFAAGAMENPGLVTFRDVLLLLDPKHTTTGMKRAQAEVIAHEFAHQWFGDLVTAQWWDDIWLNEGFATWAEAKMVDAWKPSFGATLEQVSGVQHVMDIDALRSARAVREPVHSSSDAMEAFDGLTYDKGAAVLRMIEAWLGPDTFRRGVQRYIHENAWKNARANDLFKALDFVSAQKVGDLADGFLDKPGVPSVLLSWKCGGKEGSRVELRESEWRPLGGEGEQPRKWTLPVCIAADTQKGKSCFTLGAEPITRELSACPTWLYPNADQAGYYRFVLDKAQLLALTRSERALDPADRLGLVSNAWAAVRQGAIDPGTLLDALPRFDAETHRLVVEQLVGVLQGVDQALVDDSDRLAFQRYVVARMAGRKAALGWEPRGKEDDERALTRRTVLLTMGALAYDAATLAEAEKLAQRWLKDPSSVTADAATVAVPLASIKAGAPRLDELRAALKNARSPADRELAIRSMGMFDDPTTLRHALDLTLTDELRLSDLRYIFGSARAHRAGQATLYRWEKDNWEKLKARIPASGRRGLVAVAASMCTAADRDDAKAFFVPATHGLEGTQRDLEEGLEQAQLCVALRDHGAAEVSRYLRKK